MKPINSITEGVIWKQLLVFFFPILLGSFFQQLYNTVDTVIVGRFVGDYALAAVGGTTSIVIGLLVGFFIGLSSGATVVISQYFGAGDHKRLSDSIHTAAALSLVGGVVITVLGLLFSPMILTAMHTPPEVLPLALTYIQIYFAGALAVVIYNIGSGILRALGNSKLPLFFLIICCIVNIVLDLLFVVVFRWGVMGVAVATLLSQVVSAVLTVIALCKIGPLYSLHFKKIKFHWPILVRIFQIGIPGGLQSVLYSLSKLFIQTGINGFGASTMAMWTAYSKLDSFYWMVLSAFGVSITTFVGQNFGARNYDRVRKSIRTCLFLSFLATLFIIALLYLFGGQLFEIFSQNPNIVKSGAYYMRIICPFYLCYLFVEILSGAMRGVGDTFIPLLITIFGICGLRFLWVIFVVPQSPEFLTIILSYPVTWAITGLAFILYHLRGNWLRKRIPPL